MCNEDKELAEYKMRGQRNREENMVARDPRQRVHVFPVHEHPENAMLRNTDPDYVPLTKTHKIIRRTIITVSDILVQVFSDDQSHLPKDLVDNNRHFFLGHTEDHIYEEILNLECYPGVELVDAATTRQAIETEKKKNAR